MFPIPPLLIDDGLNPSAHAHHRRQRREWLMNRCDGVILLAAPTHGPNQTYAWAHHYAPVYQDSYLLYLTGINQHGLIVLLDTHTNHHHIFLPDYDANRVFWEGHQFAYGDKKTHDVLECMAFTHIHSIHELDAIIDHHGATTQWHIPLSPTPHSHLDDHHRLHQQLRDRWGDASDVKNIVDLTWEQRWAYDTVDHENLQCGAKKTAIAFESVLKQGPFESETQLCGQLIGDLLKQTCYGLAFPPIVAGNHHATTLHYTSNSAALSPHDLVLMDFGLRWQTICTDVSRTIPVSGRYTDLQRRLMGIVLETQAATMAHVRAGVSFKELNDIGWDYMEKTLARDFISKGGSILRPYTRKPHNIGHLLGIQVHDGPPNRTYLNRPLAEGAMITIEPGLYGTFSLDGVTQSYGIRIEDNLQITANGSINHTLTIPKTCDDIEAIMMASA